MEAVVLDLNHRLVCVREWYTYFTSSLHLVHLQHFREGDRETESMGDVRGQCGQTATTAKQ